MTVKKLIIALALGCVAFIPARASAAICTIPNVITNGNIIDATPVQQNFNALVNCVNNIDWTNIDATGIYASQIIPINPGTATFGGSVAYTFTSALYANQGLIVDSTASPPTSGIEGGANGTTFLLTSVAGSSAPDGFKMVASTALPTNVPVLLLNLSGGTQLFQVDHGGDGIFAGGVSIDGASSDGSSLIGGQGTTPFWLISQNGSGAASNFAIKDAVNTIPAVFWEKSTGAVIFELDGVGDGQFAGAVAVDNDTPGPNGVIGGITTTPFKLSSDAAGAGYAFTFRDVGGNTAFAQFVNSSAATIHTIDAVGGETFGASSQTVVEPTSASFGGSVNVQTAVGNAKVVCTDGSGNLIGCGNGSGNLPFFYNVGTAKPLSSPIVIQGNTSVSLSCAATPSAFPSNGGTAVVSFPVNFSGSGYSVTITSEGRNVIFQANSKSSSGFTIAADVFNCLNTSITADWTAVGN